MLRLFKHRINSNPSDQNFAQKAHCNRPHFLLKWNITNVSRFWKQTANNNANYHKKLHVRSLRQFFLTTSWMNSIKFPSITFLGFLACWLADFTSFAFENCCNLHVCISLFGSVKLDFLGSLDSHVNWWQLSRVLYDLYTPQKYKYKIPVVFIVLFDLIVQWSCSLLQVNLDSYYYFSRLSFVSGSHYVHFRAYSFSAPRVRSDSVNMRSRNTAGICVFAVYGLLNFVSPDFFDFLKLTNQNIF